MSEYGYTTKEVKEKIDPGEGWELVPRDETRCKVDDEWRDAAGGWTRIREGTNAVGMTVKRVTECHPECLAIRRRKPVLSRTCEQGDHTICNGGKTGGFCECACHVKNPEHRYGFLANGEPVPPPPKGWEIVPEGKSYCGNTLTFYESDGQWHVEFVEGNRVAKLRGTIANWHDLAYARCKTLPSDYGKPYPHIACRCGMCGVTMTLPPPFAAEVAAELKRATEKYPTRTSQEKGFQLMMRHFIKLARSTSQVEARRRLVQIAAMCQRFAENLLEKGSR